MCTPTARPNLGLEMRNSVSENQWTVPGAIIMRTQLILVHLALCAAVLPASAEDATPCRVNVILFVPAGVNPPADYQRRVDEIVAYTEAFFTREFKRWGHDEVVMPFRRTPEGQVEVTLVRGKQPVSGYLPVSVRGEVMDLNRAQDKLAGGRQVWWILTYAGDPPAKFPGYLGGFGEQIGGWAVCNFSTLPGRIDPEAELGCEFLEDLTLKGMIHELGHGFQLPHIGPLRNDDAGNTLMGPTHYNFRRIVPAGEERVYLSRAEAALLANHPAFQGKPDPPAKLPTFEIRDLEYVFDREAKSIVVSGRVVSRQRAVLAVVGDESDARPGEYWTKTYVSQVEPDGRFEVIVSEPAESNGTLKTWFAFEGGAQTGDGKSRGRESGVAQPYLFSRGQWTFK